MEEVNTQFRGLMQKIDALSLRERFLVFLVVVGIILGTWSTFFHQPNKLERQKLVDDVTRIEMEISSKTRLIEEIMVKRSFDPNKSTREQLSRIESQLNKMKAQVDSKAVGFISPRQMAQALEELLQQGDLVLINLETLSPTQFYGDGDNAQKQPPKNELSDAPLVYRHGLTIEFEGSYFQTLRYLKTLEALKWRFYWDMVDYKVQTYPLARTKISVYTLSFEEGWLGV